jgi:hypothetical protein
MDKENMALNTIDYYSSFKIMPYEKKNMPYVTTQMNLEDIM